MKNYYDSQKLTPENIHSLHECINAMQNSNGGIIFLPDNQELHITPSDSPVSLNGNVWRRIEGINVISSKWAKSILASHDSCDDITIENDSLNYDYINEFRDKVIKNNDYYSQFDMNEFLRRTGIFSGKYITFSGALMFGDTLRFSAALIHKNIHVEIHAVNIWEVITKILPRLTIKLNHSSSQNLKSSLINTLLHSNYNIDKHINIKIIASPPRALINYPGIITRPENNLRLKKIFDLASMKTAQPQNINQEQDMLNFRIISTIKLTGIMPVIL